MRRLLLIALAAAAAGAASADAPGAPERSNLDASERKVFSQFGEDGVIEKIFEVIEPTSRFVVEFGAYDAVEHSSSRNLIVNHGWGGLLIEGMERRAKAIGRVYRDNPKVKSLNAWVYPGNIEILFEENGVPADVDLLVIDIDSNDYYVWRAIHEFRPKLVMIEVNPSFPPPQRMVIDFHPMNYWDHDNYLGASLQSYFELGKRKGYELVYCMSVGPNCLFVDERYYARFGIDDNSPVKLFKVKGAALENPTELPEDKKFLHHRAYKVKKRFILDR